jgi:precorrin-6A/cobalt-precorrin-6A reductase
VILLLGGTSETGTIAAALAAAGVRVLVSTATGLDCSVRETGLIAVRRGVLDEAGLCALILERGARAVVDATHPYAAQITRNAQAAAARAGVPYLRFLRPPSATGGGEVVVVRDHEAAARRAMVCGRPVLLTIGTRNLAPYLREAQAAAVTVIARVLPTQESLQACQRAGLASRAIIPDRGPFTVEQNVAAIKRHGIGVLVTKDGGDAGGVPAKLEAARREGCEVVVVARPDEGSAAGRAFSCVDDLIAACIVR